jgi:CHAT domain-containing protein/Tfp pilus assembly protein PilF
MTVGRSLQTSAVLLTVMRLALVAALVAALGVGASSELQDRTGALTPASGQPLDGSRGASGTVLYRIPANAGEYIRVAVEQPGDVIIRVITAAGEPVGERYKVEPLDRPERISWIADQAGEYAVELRSRDEKLPAEDHLVRIEERRGARLEDRTTVQAEREYETGEQLRRRGNADASRTAIDHYQKALALWRSDGRRDGEADALLGIGLTYRLLSENQRALEFYLQSLPPRRSAKDPWAEAFTLQNIALVHRTWGDFQRATDYYRQAFSLARLNGDRRAEAEGLNGLARVQFELGELQSALDHNAQALPVTRALGDRRGEAYALNNMGAVHYMLGDAETALAYYGKALSLRRALEDRLGESNTLVNVGAIHLANGEARRAVDCFEQALEIGRALGNRRAQGQTLMSLGAAHRALGDHGAALEALTQSASLCNAVGDRLCESDALADLAVTEMALSRAVSREHLSRALTMKQALGDMVGEAQTLVKFARLEESAGNLDQARLRAEAALAMTESQRAKVASPILRASYLSASRDAYELYVDVLMRLHVANPSAGHAAEALRVSEAARARSLLDTLTEARSGIREGVDAGLLERQRSIRQQINAKATQSVSLSAAQGNDSSRKLVEEELDGLLRDYRQVEVEIRTQSPRYAALVQPVPLTLAEIQQVVDEGTLLLEYALGNDRSYVWAVTSSSMTAHELPGRGAIETVARQVYELLQQSHRPGVGAQARRATAELSRMLLGPVSKALGTRRLIIVPDGALQFVPFAALPNPAAEAESHPLVVGHEIVVLPSASVVAALRSPPPGRPKADRVLAVLADPVLERSDPRVQSGTRGESQALSVASSTAMPPDLLRSATEAGMTRFERLRFTRQEAQTITELAGGKATLTALDFEASRATAMRSELGHYRLLHFASHALLNTQHPELSGIVLSLVAPDGTAQDGFLRLHDIYNMRLGAGLVVLSACQTALGREIKGEGLVGLTRGFMYAGAPRVVASLWDVRDAGTSQLMTRFYRGMLRDGLRPAAALRAAQIALLQDPAWSAPVYWAGFILQGEWK